MRGTDPTELRVLRAELLDAHRELVRLRTQTEQLVASNKDLSGMLGASSSRLGEVTKAVVAFERLLAAPDTRAAWLSVEDILVNVVGIEDFVILQLGETDALQPVGGRGTAFDHACDTPPTLRAVRAGPARIVPLYIGENLVAVVVIAGLVPHREALTAADDQVLALLSRFAGTAVMMAEKQKSWLRLTPPAGW
jgi:hypothetical protein